MEKVNPKSELSKNLLKIEAALGRRFEASEKKLRAVFWAGPADCAGSVGRILGGVSQDLILPDSQRSGTICLELGHGRIGKDLAVDLARRAPASRGRRIAPRIPPGLL